MAKETKRTADEPKGSTAPELPRRVVDLTNHDAPPTDVAAAYSKEAPMSEKKDIFLDAVKAALRPGETLVKLSVPGDANASTVKIEKDRDNGDSTYTTTLTDQSKVRKCLTNMGRKFSEYKGEITQTGGLLPGIDGMRLTPAGWKEFGPAADLKVKR